MDISKAKILVVEDDPASLKMMKVLLESEGWEPILAANGLAGLEGAKRELPQAVLLDLGLPDLKGMEVLERLKREQPQVPVLILSGDSELESAVQAIRLGAHNYFLKPINTDQVLAALRGLLERDQLLKEVSDLKGRLSGGSLQRLMGPSQAVKHLQAQVEQVAGSPLTVLVHGETGSGKEVVSRAIHDLSPRSGKPFIALDCGAIPDTLLESELFGYEKGAFSGAERKKEGQILLAQGGTLFLDEIANLPWGLQAKLLRVLQERSLTPLGGTKSVSLDVRIVAASHGDLEKEAAEGRFRQDLYFRLAEFRIEIPPLRERAEDIPYLAQRFLEEASVEMRRPLASLSPEALALLNAQPWPGNVRELRNVVRQAVLLAKGGALQAQDLSGLLKPGLRKQAGKAALRQGHSLKAIGEAALAAAEIQAIREALAKTRGNILQAARSLKTDNKTLHVKLKKYGLRARDFEDRGEGHA
jgi:DNA-binding NtrC family response regulator